MAKTRFENTGIKLFSLLLTAGLICLTGCGGSSEVASPRSGKLMGGRIIEKADSNGNTLKTVPRFEDISGITYRSDKRVGVTDRDGTFFYKPGETIDFAIDKVIIGKLVTSTTESGYAYTKLDPNNSEFKYYIPTTSADEDRILLASVKDIAAGREAELDDEKSVNLVRFLESLDENKEPADGITINKNTATMVQEVCDGLGITQINLSDDSQIRSIIAGLNSVSGSGSFALPEDPEKMRKDLYASYAKYKAMPLALINLGDGFMAGAQAGRKNIHEATQNRGSARITGDLLIGTSNLATWQSPKLSMDSSRAVTRKTDTDTDGNSVINIPSNVAYPEASCLDIISKYTGSGDAIMDELLKPVSDTSHLKTPATQLDSAIYAASQNAAKGRIKIFTIWAGMQDVYKNVIPGTPANLDNVTSGLDSVDSVKDSMTKTVSRIKSDFPSARIFIGTLPDIDTMAISLSRSDISAFVSNTRLNGISSPNLDGMDQESRIGLDAFISKIAPKLYPGIPAESVNAALASLSSAEILSQAEQNELKNRTDEINAHIKSLADGKNVFSVDINGLFRDLKNGRFAYVDSKYIVRVPDGGIGYTESTVRYMSPVWGGGFFSSDGFYPSHTGNALVANSFYAAMIKAGLGIEPENIYKPSTLTINHDKAYWYINVEAAWNIDPYRDFDGDGFPGGPGTMPPTDKPLEYIPVGDPYFTPIEDCDDLTTDTGKTNKLPKAVTGSACQ